MSCKSVDSSWNAPLRGSRITPIAGNAGEEDDEEEDDDEEAEEEEEDDDEEGDGDDDAAAAAARLGVGVLGAFIGAGKIEYTS